MPRVGFEHTPSVFEWTKTVHDLDRAAHVIGVFRDWSYHIRLLQEDRRGTYSCVIQ
jgi:hypothetical protein